MGFKCKVKSFFIKGFYQKFEVVTHFNIFMKYFLVHWIQQLIPKLRIKMVPGLSSFYLYLPTFTYFHAFLFRPIWWSSGHSSFKTVLIWTGHGYLTVHCVYSNHPEQWHHRRRHHQGKWTVFESFLNVLVWHREMLRVLFRQICVLSTTCTSHIDANMSMCQKTLYWRFVTYFLFRTLSLLT